MYIYKDSNSEVLVKEDHEYYYKTQAQLLVSVTKGNWFCSECKKRTLGILLTHFKVIFHVYTCTNETLASNRWRKKFFKELKINT